MKETWYSWVYLMSRQENEPLPGHLEIDGVRMTVPPLEQADIKAGICLLSSEGKEAGWIRTNVPAAKKKGFLQWAARVLFGRLFAKKGEKERFWSSAGDVAAGEFPLSDTGDLRTNGLIGQAGLSDTKEREALFCLHARVGLQPGERGREAGAFDMEKQTDLFTVDVCKAAGCDAPKLLSDCAAPDVSSPAAVQFRTLYTDKKQRKNKRVWMEYFMSPAFLEVWRRREFTAGLLKIVQSEEGAPPISLLRQLCITYGIRYRRQDISMPDGSMQYQYRPCLIQGAAFPGIDSIVRITEMGEPVCGLSHQDEVIRAAGFGDFWSLLLCNDQLGQYGTELVRQDYEKIFSMYKPEHLEKPAGISGYQWWDIPWRDACGLRLLEEYVRLSDTKDSVLELVFQVLDLKHAVNGRMGYWYGSLRHAVLERLPRLEFEEQKSFQVALRAYDGYRTWSFDRQCIDDEADAKRVEKLFSFENFKLALQDGEFARNYIFPYWMNVHRTDKFLVTLQDFCRSHPEAESCRRIAPLCGQLLQAKRLLTEGRVAEMRPDTALFQPENGPFWWYFLRVAFIRSMDDTDTSGRNLADMMEKDLPPLHWEERMLAVMPDGDLPVLGRMISIPAGKRFLHIQFHRSYLQYYLDDEPVWQPLFDWEWVRCLDSILFWFFLPLTSGDAGQSREMEPEIRRRLSRLLLPGCRHEKTAALLTGYLTHRAATVRNEHMARREIHGVLYSFLVDQNRMLRCFCGQHENRQYRQVYTTVQEAVEQGMEWLAVMESLYEDTPLLPWEHLPDTICITRYGDSGIRLSGPEEVTPESTACWVEHFLKDHPAAMQRVTRLELSWGNRMAEPGTGEAGDSLVLLEKDGRYMALYFAGREYLSIYGAMARRDLYKASGNHEMDTFGGRPVPGYFVYLNRDRLVGLVYNLLRQIGSAGSASMDFPQWSFLPVRTGDVVAFKRAKREWGEFEDETARNKPKDRMETPHSPDWMYAVDAEGTATTYQGWKRFQQTLPELISDYFDGRITMLQAGWDNKQERYCSILLLRDATRYLLLYRNHVKESGSYWVGDRSGYLNAEGKVRKIDFCGRKVEFYLLHTTQQTIRDGLDILLPGISQAEAVTQKFLEWSYATQKELDALPALWQLPDHL